MRIQLAVIGAGSLLGRHLCRRAVRIGWDVHAFSIYDLNEMVKQSKTFRQRTFYEKRSMSSKWTEEITWDTNLNYDENFNDLKEEIRNATGLVYFYEETPLLKSKKKTFEQNVIDLSKHAGNWSVRHFVAVESENCLLNKETEQRIGDTTNPFMILSLLRPGKVYSYDHFTTCLDVYKSRTLRSIGLDTKPVHAINAETVAKCITTLIHNTNDPNIYRILEGNDMEQYLSEQKIPFDSPHYDYYFNQDEIENNDDGQQQIDNNDDDDDDDDEKQQENKKKIVTVGFDENNDELNQVNELNDINEIESCRDEEEKTIGKIL